MFYNIFLNNYYLKIFTNLRSLLHPMRYKINRNYNSIIR